MNVTPAPVQPPASPPVDRRPAVIGAVALAILALLAVGLVALVLVASDGGVASGATPTDPASYAYADVADAPPLELTDQAGRPFTLASLEGRPALVFFGYTHCPDVCPTTVGTLNEVFAEVGDTPRAVFVSVDPERDGVEEMASYVRYLPKQYIGLSGSPDEILRNTQAWGVKYAKVDEGSPGGYAMAHTADVFLVDAQGRLRARFPFGTAPEVITATVRDLLAETPAPSDGPAASAPADSSPAVPGPGPATPAPTAVAPASPAPVAGDLGVLLVSSSVWSGPETPVIVTVTDEAGTPLDGSVPMTARVVGSNETQAGPDVPVVAILPEGAQAASFVANVTIPSPGWWRLDLTGADGSRGSVNVEALDPGTTAPIGQAAPDIDTPTLDDVGGQALAITTQPAPDLRMSRTSTADARAAGTPYVLVVDSSRFKVSPACGRALTMIRYLLDRWTNVPFIHLEPFEYQVITNEPVLSGDLADPPLNTWASAFGLGDEVWPATEMPWIFVVDGDGIVRAKHTGIVGSADVDVILSLIEGTHIVGG
jgi:protein SCO1/2